MLSRFTKMTPLQRCDQHRELPLPWRLLRTKQSPCLASRMCISVLFRVASQSPDRKLKPYKLLLKLSQRVADLLVQGREDGLGLLDCLLLRAVVSIRS